MIAGALLAAVLAVAPQDTLPTVGDTVVVARRLRVPAGAVVRPAPFPASPLADPLGAPRLVTAADGAGSDMEVEYALVFWRPGDHTIELPDIVVIRADGRADTLPPLRRLVRIGSVLPVREQGDTAKPPPQPPATEVRRLTRSAQPVLVLGAVTLLLLIPVHVWWRKRGPGAPAAPAPAVEAATTARLQRWVELGETRVALDGWRRRLEALPLTEPERGEARDALVARIEAAGYAPVHVDAESALCAEAAAWFGDDEAEGGT